MKPADAEEYTQALGQVVAGGWRQVALGKRLGVPEALGLTLEQWVDGRLGGYVRLSIPERREAVGELTALVENGGQGLSNRAAAQVLGVDAETVRRDNAANAAPQPELANGDGPADQAPAANAAPGVDDELTIEEAVDELPDASVRLRRRRAQSLLVKAHAATALLSPSLDAIAEAVLAQHPDQVREERDRLKRDRAALDRLIRALDARQLRRVK